MTLTPPFITDKRQMSDAINLTALRAHHVATPHIAHTPHAHAHPHVTPPHTPIAGNPSKLRHGLLAAGMGAAALGVAGAGAGMGAELAKVDVLRAECNHKCSDEPEQQTQDACRTQCDEDYPKESVVCKLGVCLSSKTQQFIQSIGIIIAAIVGLIVVLQLTRLLKGAFSASKDS